jgi:hypothetical protein
MRRTSSATSWFFACAVVVAASSLVACGPKEPERLLNQPPAPVRTGSPLPFAPVERPVDLAKFESDPCGLLTKEQVAAVVVDPPTDVKPGRTSNTTEFGCAWNTWQSPLVSVLKPLKSPMTLGELSASYLKRAGKLEPWTETSLDGLPVVVYHELQVPDECDVAVGVGDGQLLKFSFHGQGRSTYWEEDRCGGVLKTAEFVIGNLRAG